nr:MAG TPA: hypothetical protein [Caudoviricetes sp.]
MSFSNNIVSNLNYILIISKYIIHVNNLQPLF